VSGADPSALEGIDSIAKRADALYSEQSYNDAYALLDAAPRSAETLWRKARVCKELSDAAKANGQKETQKEQVLEGLQLAEEALSLDDNNFAAHKWYAILTSFASGFEGTKAQIEKSFVVKEHFERATQLDPADATSRHLLGLWYYEVAGLSWTVRKLAAAIFASPPVGTYEDALAHFTAAEQIKPGFYLKNRLLLGKTYIAIKNRPAAREWLQKAVGMEAKTREDGDSLTEAQKLLAGL